MAGAEEGGDVRLPWWLNPWREVRVLRWQRGEQEIRIRRMAELVSEMSDNVTRLKGHLAAAERQLRGNLHTATADQKPEFVLVGIDRGPVLGKRLIAARDLPGAELGMTAIDDPPPRWQIRATLDRPLFIDGPDYATALDRMRAIWANWDKAATGGLPVEPPARGAIGS